MKDILKKCLIDLALTTLDKFINGESTISYEEKGKGKNNTTQNSNASFLGNSGRVEYGYNAKGNYCPSAIGTNGIEYGYNVKGHYVPKSIGKNKVEYGYNVKGDFVPLYLDNKKIEYGYNVKGDFVIKEIRN